MLLLKIVLVGFMLFGQSCCQCLYNFYGSSCLNQFARPNYPQPHTNNHFKYYNIRWQLEWRCPLQLNFERYNQCKTDDDCQSTYRMKCCRFPCFNVGICQFAVPHYTPVCPTCTITTTTRPTTTEPTTTIRTTTTEPATTTEIFTTPETTTTEDVTTTFEPETTTPEEPSSTEIPTTTEAITLPPSTTEETTTSTTTTPTPWTSTREPDPEPTPA